MLPCSSTRTRSAIVETTPRSCVISNSESPKRFSELGDQVKYGSLDRYVQSRGDFVADHHVRGCSKGPSDPHTLALPAGELRRIPVFDPLRQSNEAQQSIRLSVSLAAREAAQHLGRPCDRASHRVPWVERVARVLEDDLNPLSLLLETAGVPEGEAPHLRDGSARW